MSDYPERISISPVHRQKHDDDFYLVDRKAFPGKGTEYVRADRIEELEAKLAKAVEAMSEALGAYEHIEARMVDDDGELVGVGDWIMFSYGIPPVRVYARLSTVKGVLTLTTQGKHKPRTMALAKLRDHVGCWYKSSGPMPALAELTGGKDE